MVDERNLHGPAVDPAAMASEGHEQRGVSRAREENLIRNTTVPETPVGEFSTGSGAPAQTGSAPARETQACPFCPFKNNPAGAVFCCSCGRKILNPQDSTCECGCVPRLDTNGQPVNTAWHDVFLKAMRVIPSPKPAYGAAGVSRSLAYLHREQYPTFAKAWDEARDEGFEAFEAVGMQRAKTVSDQLWIAIQRAYHQRYDRRNEVLNVNVSLDEMADLDDEDLRQIANGEDVVKILSERKKAKR